MRGLVDDLPNPNPLVTALPAPFQGQPFTERFLSAFDDAVAPILLTLDTMDAYLDPALTPPDFLPWLAGWVGLELDENWSLHQQRRMVGQAVELLRWRGTRRGTSSLIEDYLGISADRIEIEDTGGVAWSPTPDADPPGSAPPSVRVRVRVGEDEIDVRRLERLVAAAIPAHVAWEIEVGSA